MTDAVRELDVAKVAETQYAQELQRAGSWKRVWCVVGQLHELLSKLPNCRGETQSVNAVVRVRRTRAADR